MSPGFLEHQVGGPGDGPDLAAVRVPAELEVDARLLGFFQVVGLVVQEDSKAFQAFCEFLQGGPVPG